MSEGLKVMELPLRGGQLVEASAGTGKTWTIAAVYLRLVLGMGTPGDQPLMPEQILVMTFTKAATRELVERIRARLVQASHAFLEPPSLKPSTDGFLDELIRSFPQDAARREAGLRLAMAAEAMDDAAICTIDAWCQRVLVEQAIDSGVPLGETLQTDERPLLLQAVRDYWRQQVVPLDARSLELWHRAFKGVDDLQSASRPLLGASEAPASPPTAITLEQCIRQQLQTMEAAANALKPGWSRRAQSMQDWARSTLALPTAPFKANQLKPQRVLEVAESIRAWAEGDALQPDILQIPPPRLSTLLGRFTRTGFQAALKSDFQSHPIPDWIDDCEALFSACLSAPDPLASLRTHAARAIHLRLQQLKHQSARFGFADLLVRLHAALGAPDESADRLRARLRQRYPVVLIDEFQDTSALQYEIFDRIYRIGQADESSAVLLIGDPKQSIYGFRGADIQSYLRARRALTGRHHHLLVNYRSTPAVMAAINGLFGAAEARVAGQGAFLHDSDIPFQSCQANGRPETLVQGGNALTALTICTEPVLRGKPQVVPLYARLCAQRIAQWLNDPTVGFTEPDKPHRRLQASDVCVLVQNGAQAAQIKKHLARQGLPSVYLSDRDSVYASTEATDLLDLLKAVHEPARVSSVRSALATTLLARSPAEWDALARSDAAWAEMTDTLWRLQGIWATRGVSAMVLMALDQLQITARWRSHSGGGERVLTNLLHLAELLQKTGTGAGSREALIRRLAASIEEAQDASAGDIPADDAIIRLESDARLIQVVTIHKSKGLEYPCVFIPFATMIRPETVKKGAVRLKQEQGQWQALAAEELPAWKARQDEERLREGVRLLYVAMTRARHSLWVGAPPLSIGQSKDVCTWHQSALGHLVSGQDRPLDADGVRVALQSLMLAVNAPDRSAAGTGPEICTLEVIDDQAPPPVQPAIDPTIHSPIHPPIQPPARAAAGKPLPIAPRAFDTQWSISSYSSLVRADESGPHAAGPQGSRPGQGSAAINGAAIAPWHRFPKGALVGNFLHGLLESRADEGFASDEASQLEPQVRARCHQQGWPHLAEDALHWLRSVCTTELPPLGAPLHALKGARPELEFWVPVSAWDITWLDQLCRRHLYPGRDRPALAPRVLHGLLMGFADLVFEQGGRYWVLDYKSNALGPDAQAYSASALEEAVLAHRYDVQALIYLHALQGLLRTRMGTRYAAGRHLGGALFFFLRGLDHPGRGCLSIEGALQALQELDTRHPLGHPPRQSPGTTA